MMSSLSIYGFLWECFYLSLEKPENRKKKKGIDAFLRRIGKAIELPTLGCSKVDIVPYCDPTDVQQDLSGFDWASPVDPCPSGVELPLNADLDDPEPPSLSGSSVLDPESAPDQELMSVSGLSSLSSIELTPDSSQDDPDPSSVPGPSAPDSEVPDPSGLGTAFGESMVIIITVSTFIIPSCVVLCA